MPVDITVAAGGNYYVALPKREEGELCNWCALEAGITGGAQVFLAPPINWSDTQSTHVRVISIDSLQSKIKGRVIANFVKIV